MGSVGFHFFISSQGIYECLPFESKREPLVRFIFVIEHKLDQLIVELD
jgi:hypothetical protein